MKKYKTRDGRDAEIIRKGVRHTTFTTVAILTDAKGNQSIETYTDELKAYGFSESAEDLLEVGLNFKEWLAEREVDTTLFWANCRKRHQGWPHASLYDKRSKLRICAPSLWISNAFHMEKALQKDYKFWRVLEKEWVSAVLEQGTANVVFGFGES
jgi:hypothetical protein